MEDRDTRISVVIPTVGRAGKLEKSLSSYENLDPDTPPFEVIVVLDGEDQASRDVCSAPHSFPLRVLVQEPSGPGPARNLGAQTARGEFVVLLNDDTRLDPKCLLTHAAAQSDLGPCVAVGRMEWDPEIECSRYMAWLAPEGHQFNYSRLDPSRQVPWDACWGTNLALPTSWLLAEPFDPKFPVTAAEDSEWGYRLKRAGRSRRYVPDAVCFHDHFYGGPADYRRRSRIAGAASRYVVRLHPELAWSQIGRPAAAAVVRLASMLWPGFWRREMVWDLDFRANYVWGTLQPRREQRR